MAPVTIPMYQLTRVSPSSSLRRNRIAEVLMIGEQQLLRRLFALIFTHNSSLDSGSCRLTSAFRLLLTAYGSLT
jgi:hypothetical protein